MLFALLLQGLQTPSFLRASLLPPIARHADRHARTAHQSVPLLSTHCCSSLTLAVGTFTINVNDLAYFLKLETRL
jgi:hypothetical protein